jgi:hypothetical protein
VDERERVHKQGDASDDTRFVVFRVHGDTLNVADLDGTSGESPFSEGARLAIATRSEAVSLGHAQCLQQGFDDEHAEVRFGTFDLAGNFSGFTTPKPVELPGPPLLDSCALGPKAGGGWLAFVLGALLRRRLALRSRVK